MLERLTRTPARAVALVQNATEVARFGGLQTEDEPAPYTKVVRRRSYALRHYFHDAAPKGPAVLLVAPLMMSAEIWDVAETASAVRQLNESGVDAWVIDFGPPDREEGGLERTLSDHAVAVSEAIDEIRAATGRSVHLGGYSQGGMLCYQVAALRRSEGMASVISFGSPVDLRKMIPEGLPPELLVRAADLLGLIGRRVAVPGWATRNAFRMLDPVKATRKQVEFLFALHNREKLLPREGQRRFIEDNGWVAFPGPALVEFAQQFLAQNRMLEGGIVVDGRTLTLADVTCPVLAVIGDKDEVASAEAIRPLADAAPRADTWETHVNAGHLGLVVGSRAKAEAWPTVIGWTQWIDDGGDPPERATRIADARLEAAADPRPPRQPSTVSVGIDAVKTAAMGAGQVLSDVGGTVRDLTREATEQLPRLSRIQQVEQTTQTSLALTLDEQAAKEPQRIQFIYQERAVTRANAKARIDAVVAGLIDIGVRRGEHVGVLMSARPSAVVAAAALNRIGAVAVMLRPGGEVAREAALGDITRVISDPERVEEALKSGRPVFVLGGGPDRPELPDGVLDMEGIDPNEIELPAWYRPNPGLAIDIAFILFTGDGEATRVNRITNRRWLLSAYGTATAASLSVRDTVYCLAPPSHPSGLLVAIGGAIAGGARFAMAERFDPDTFWDDVRRYGVTVVSYTWRMLAPLVDAPPHPNEQRHSIRLLVGSGMSPALWRRAMNRFDPARVVEFYTAPDAEAVLVNLGGRKRGALGRPLPGSARVRIVDWDGERGRLVLNRAGLAQSTPPGKVGMLLAEVDPTDPATGHVPALRGVFAPDDAWVVTGDLARRDEDGDIWLQGAANQVIDAAGRPRSPLAIRDALEALEEVDAAVVYAAQKDGEVLAVAAISKRPGASEIDGRTLDAAIADVRPEAIPDVVRLVDVVPVTQWYRPMADGFRRDDIEAASDESPVWRLNAETGRYRLLRSKISTS